MIGESTFVRPESNAADPATLYGFFDWAASECPAEHYLLIFWGHSRGQFGMFGDSDPFDYTAQTLTLEELRDALAAAKRSLQKPVDIIAFKDCFMANLEIAYELTDWRTTCWRHPGWCRLWVALRGHVPCPHRRWGTRGSQADTRCAQRHYYGKKDNRDPHDEVPYSLLRTEVRYPSSTN